MTSKTLFLFLHTKIIGITSSWLSQSIGVYSSGHLLQIWGALEQVDTRYKMVLEVSLPKYVNILYQITRNRKCNCCFNVFVCIVSLVITSFLYQLKTLLFSSQSGAKWKNF